MASKAGGGAGQGLSTPETSSSAEALEDEQQPPGESKRKKFHPFRAVRKIFRWKVKRQATPQEVVGPSKKSRSTGELQSVPDDEQRLKVAAVTPYSIGLSVSHDSVFTSDATSSLGNDQDLCQGSSLSVNHTTQKLMFRDELFTRVQARRDSDDDDIGLPHSPCTSPTTADVLCRGLQAKSSKPQSTCSAGSLSSMFSSENDEDALGQAVHDRRGDAANNDDTASFPLSHKAALHKISVKPKRTHALPRNRRLQTLATTPPSNLPATPEVSEDCTRLVSHPTETLDIEHKQTEVSIASCSCSVPALLPKPTPLPELEETIGGETRKSSEDLSFECSDPAVADTVTNPGNGTKQAVCDNAPAEHALVSANPDAPCDSTTVCPQDNDEPCNALKKTGDNKSPQALSEVVAVTANLEQVDHESLIMDDSASRKQVKEKHDSGKPKAAELKLLHEIMEFNKRQQEIGKKSTSTEFDGVIGEDSTVDVHEMVLAPESVSKQRESKLIAKEDEEEQRKLDLLNGNVSADPDRDYQSSSLIVSQKVPSCMQPENTMNDSASEHPRQLKLSSPSKKVPFVNALDSSETRALYSPPNKREETHRRFSCMEPASPNRSKVAELQRPLSVEIIPFSQRKKDSSPSPPPLERESEPKRQEKIESLSTDQQNLVGESIPEKVPMSYPVHFRIYKGRRKSLAGDENQGPESLPLGSKSLTASLDDKPTTHHFEIKIHSAADVKEKPEPKSIVLDTGEKVEMRATDHVNDVKDQQNSTPEVLGSPPKRDDVKPRPFSRGVQGKGIASNNEPELFKVFARRSLKQKHSDKVSNNDTDFGGGDTTAGKSGHNPDDMVSITAAGGTIVKISESSAVITPDHSSGKQAAGLTQNGVSFHEHVKAPMKTEFPSASQISKIFEPTAAKGPPVKNTENSVKSMTKSVTIVSADASTKPVKVVEAAQKTTEAVTKNGWQSCALSASNPGKGSLFAKSTTESDKETCVQQRRTHGSRPRYHTSPEVAPEDIVKAVGKPQETPEKPVVCESPKISRSLQRASSVSSSSPSSSGSFRVNKADTVGLDGQPAWLQLAQQRRELREQRERALLGRPTETSFVIETSKPSRSSKVLDMVSNFQKMQMT